jgi:cell division transport system permease protein
MINHALKEGFVNIVRSFWLTATAVSVLSVSLGSVALMASFSTVLGYSVRQLDNQLTMVAFLKEDTDDKTALKIKDEISKIKEVKDTKYVNREQVQKNLQEKKEISQDTIDYFQKNNLKAGLEYIEITPTNAESYNVVASSLKNDRYQSVIKEVQANQEYVGNLIRFYEITRNSSLAIIAVFAVISILVMMNILRIAIYNYKDEIEIMRLVGATNNYIRTPFIAQGFYLNLISGLIVAVFYVPVINFLIPYINRYLGVTTQPVFGLNFQIYATLGVTILAGIIVGLITSTLATERYLQG